MLKTSFGTAVKPGGGGGAVCHNDAGAGDARMGLDAFHVRDGLAVGVECDTPYSSGRDGLSGDANGALSRSGDAGYQRIGIFASDQLDAGKLQDWPSEWAAIDQFVFEKAYGSGKGSASSVDGGDPLWT